MIHYFLSTTLRKMEKGIQVIHAKVGSIKPFFTQQQKQKQN
jgi:hypothetical protein